MQSIYSSKECYTAFATRGIVDSHWWLIGSRSTVSTSIYSLSKDWHLFHLFVWRETIELLLLLIALPLRRIFIIWRRLLLEVSSSKYRFLLLLLLIWLFRCSKSTFFLLSINRWRSTILASWHISNVILIFVFLCLLITRLLLLLITLIHIILFQSWLLVWRNIIEAETEIAFASWRIMNFNRRLFLTASVSLLGRSIWIIRLLLIWRLLASSFPSIIGFLLFSSLSLSCIL